MANEGNSRLIDYIYSEPFPLGKRDCLIDWAEAVLARTLQYVVSENRRIIDNMEKLKPKCWFEGDELKCNFIHTMGNEGKGGDQTGHNTTLTHAFQLQALASTINLK